MKRVASATLAGLPPGPKSRIKDADEPGGRRAPTLRGEPVLRNAATKEKYVHALIDIKKCGSMYMHDAKLVAISLLAGKDLCKRRHICVGDLLAVVATFEDEGSGGTLYDEGVLTAQVGEPLLLRSARTRTFDEPTPASFGLEEK